MRASSLSRNAAGLLLTAIVAVFLLPAQAYLINLLRSASGLGP